MNNITDGRARFSIPSCTCNSSSDSTVRPPREASRTSARNLDITRGKTTIMIYAAGEATSATGIVSKEENARDAAINCSMTLASHLTTILAQTVVATPVPIPLATKRAAPSSVEIRERTDKTTLKIINREPARAANASRRTGRSRKTPRTTVQTASDVNQMPADA